MGELDSIVKVQISRETSVPTEVGFGIGLLLGQSGKIDDGVVKEYASTTEMTEDVFVSSDPEVTAASDYFSQAKKPEKIKVANAVPNGGKFILKQAAATDISVDINGQTVTGADLATLATNIAALSDVSSAAVKDTNYLLVEMNAGYTATVQNLTAATGSIALIQGNISSWDFGEVFNTSCAITVDGTEETSAVSYADLVTEAIGNVALTVADGFADGNVIYLVADGTTPNVLTLGKNNAVEVGTVGDETTKTMFDILSELVGVDDDFYAILSITFLEVNVLSIAEWTEANSRIFATRTNDADMLTAPDTTSISYQLQQLGYDRTFVQYSANATTEYLDAAILGRQLPEDAGSVDWDLIKLSSVTPDDLKLSSKVTAIKSTNGNYFKTTAGANYYQEGKVASGEWIDIIRGTDWLVARMQERIFTTKANSKKIPYTNPGIAKIEADIRAQLEDGIDRTLLDGERGFTVTTPNALNVSAADKAARTLKDVTFQAYYAGAIIKTEIQGTISL